MQHTFDHCTCMFCFTVGELAARALALARAAEVMLRPDSSQTEFRCSR
jgi:hypothetical protein